MLTAVTRIKIAVFAVVAVLVIAYIGVNYADVGRYIGLRGYYTVQLDLPSTGGLFEGSAVSYRGVTVGKVGKLDLTSDARSASSTSTSGRAPTRGPTSRRAARSRAASPPSPHR